MFIYVDTTKDVFLNLIKNNQMESINHCEEPFPPSPPREETFDDFTEIISEVENTPYSHFSKEFIEFDF